MNLRWIWGNYTDPEHELSRQEQWDLSWAAYADHIPPSRFVWWTLVVVVAPTLLVIKFALPATLKWLGRDGQTGAYVVGLAVIMLLFWPWSAFAYRTLFVKPIRRSMRDRGHDPCIECGHLLNGLDTCPECGAAREAPPSDAPDAPAG